MISLASALDGELTVWRADGGEYRLPVTEFVTGSATNALAAGDVLRSVPARRRAAGPHRLPQARPVAAGPFRRGRHRPARHDADGGRFVLSVTAATVRPYVFTFPGVPDGGRAGRGARHHRRRAWTSDAHGDPDWRRAVTLVLAEEIREELA